VVPRGERRFAGFDDTILSLYGRGMATRRRFGSGASGDSARSVNPDRPFLIVRGDIGCDGIQYSSMLHATSQHISLDIVKLFLLKP
jgi:hypothetical protein